MIEAFGNFVVGGNYIIGAVIFLVLIAIQYVVINHGAVRISEVTARFTLDALPGKQMSIDSDLNAGLIDETEARAAAQAAGRRSRVLRRHGRRLALHAARCGGQHPDHRHQIIAGLSDRRAAARHGSAARAPDLHRADHRRRTGDGDPGADDFHFGRPDRHPRQFGDRLGAEFQKQVFGNPQPLMLASGVLVALALFPGLADDSVSAAGRRPGLRRPGGCGRRAAVRQDEAAAEAGAPAKENLEALLRVEPLAIEVGLGLVKLVEGGAESPLLRRIAGIRRQLATELGYLLPPVRVTDNLSLRSREYVISLKGVEIARYELPQGCELAIPAGKADAAHRRHSHARAGVRHAGAGGFRRPGRDARAAPGYTVVDPVSVLGTHLAELVRRHAHELFSRQDTKKLLDRVAWTTPRWSRIWFRSCCRLATVQRVLQNLLRERVSIRDAVTILEAWAKPRRPRAIRCC